MNQMNTAKTIHPNRVLIVQMFNTMTVMFSRMVAVLKQWRRRYVTREHLRRLDHHRLDDVGISPAAQGIEVNKPFWRG